MRIKKQAKMSKIAEARKLTRTKITMFTVFGTKALTKAPGLAIDGIF